jgi:hypothetical protein
MKLKDYLLEKKILLRFINRYKYIYSRRGERRKVKAERFVCLPIKQLLISYKNELKKVACAIPFGV